MDNTISKGTKSCPSCLTVNNISADFCTKCAHPIGEFVNLDPVGQVQSQGHLFREAANKPRSLIILVGLWLYFGIVILGVLLVLFFSHNEFPFLVDILFIGIALLSCSIIYKTTRNYFKRK